MSVDLTFPCVLLIRKDFESHWAYLSGKDWQWHVGPGTKKPDFGPVGVFLTHDGEYRRAVVYGDNGKVYVGDGRESYWITLPFVAKAERQLVHLWYDQRNSKLIGVGKTGHVFDISELFRNKMKKVGEVPYDPSGELPIWPYGFGWRHNDYCMDAKGRIHGVSRNLQTYEETAWVYSDDHGQHWIGPAILQSAGSEKSYEYHGYLQKCRAREQTIVCHGDAVHMAMGLVYSNDENNATRPISGPADPKGDLTPHLWQRKVEYVYCVRHIGSLNRGNDWRSQNLYVGLALHKYYMRSYVNMMYWESEVLEVESGNDISYEESAEGKFVGTPDPTCSFGSGRVSCCATDNEVIVTAPLSNGEYRVWRFPSPRNSNTWVDTIPHYSIDSGIGPSSRNWIGGDQALVCYGEQGVMGGLPNAAKYAILLTSPESSRVDQVLISSTNMYVPVSVAWPDLRTGSSFWW